MKNAGLALRGTLGIAALMGVIINCGGSTGENRGGTGGTTAAGGTVTTTGGTIPAAGGNQAGTGGTTTAPVGLSCTPGVSPGTALLTDFSATSWEDLKGKWGTETNLRGSVFDYPDPAKLSKITTKVDVTRGLLTYIGTVVPATTGGGYAGAGMSFDQCVNTTAYKGIQFTLGGSTGGCTLRFQVQTFSQQSTSQKGGCTSSCYKFPNKVVTIGADPVTVLFADLAGTGTPATATAISAEMVGLQWQFEIPSGTGDGGIQVPCSVDMTVDNVQFVP